MYWDELLNELGLVGTGRFLHKRRGSENDSGNSDANGTKLINVMLA